MKDKECHHQFFKDRNPPECLNCGKTEEVLWKEYLDGFRRGAVIMSKKNQSIKELKQGIKLAEEEMKEWQKFITDAKKRLGSQDLGDTHIYKKEDLVGGVTTTSEDAECCDCGGELHSKEEKEVEMCGDCIWLLDK